MAILKKFTFSCRNSKFSAACMEPECPSRGAEEISANGKTSCFKYNKKGGKFWAQWRNRERCYFILSWAWNKKNSESPWGTELLLNQSVWVDYINKESAGNWYLQEFVIPWYASSQACIPSWSLSVTRKMISFDQ